MSGKQYTQDFKCDWLGGESKTASQKRNPSEKNTLNFSTNLMLNTTQGIYLNGMNSAVPLTLLGLFPLFAT